MSAIETMLSKWTPQLLAILRITTAYTFIHHGTAKLFKYPFVEALAKAPLASIYGVAGIIEVVFGVLVLIGLFTRPAAFILSGQMAVAYFMAHSTPFLFPILNRGESAYLFCFIFLFLAGAGAGAWSVDSSRGKA